MLKFQTVNELALRITANANDIVFTKAGAFVSGECMGPKNFQFEKVLLGPQGNIGAALVGQLTRRFTGENLPLMKVTFRGESVTYYANCAQHVVCYELQPGETISVESENILAFTSQCKYSVRFLAQGIISQKGLATSTLTGTGPGAYVAILCDGNPLVMSNMQNGATIEVDPDAVVAWIGSGNCDPQFKMDLSWKNLIGQASGESYMFEWSSNQRATIILQPNERAGSGINIGMDGGSSGQRAQRQQNQSLGEAAGSIRGTLGGLADAGSRLGGSVGDAGSSLGGLLNGLGGLLQ